MKRKVLFFITGPVPTKADVAAASEIVGNVVFRNANFAGSEHPEICDAVAGCVPENYSHLPCPKDLPEPGCEEPAAKPAAKPGRKPKVEIQPAQTPLIPAETGWKPNA